MKNGWLLLLVFAWSCKLMPKEDKAKKEVQTNNMQKDFDRVPWRHATNIYEVNLRQYTQEGTFNAFAKELPRLREMGVEVLWFMPITPISKVGMKGTLGSYYACSDYKAVNPEFGNLQDFKNMVDTAHALGFKVIIDWVANHTGNEHVWMKEHKDFYNYDSTGKIINPNGWDDVSDLNYDNPKLQDSMIDALQYWVRECKIDGYRCDMAMLVPLQFWKKARTEVDKIKPCFWLAECEEKNYYEVFDAMYSWEWMHKTEEYCKGKLKLEDLWNQLYKMNFEFDKVGAHTFFTSNHDENSWNGTDIEKYGDARKPLSVFSCTWNGIPMIYSGQEMPNPKRLKFFDKDPIEWNGKHELHDFYKTLLNLHSLHPALRSADPAVKTLHIQTNANDKIMAYARINGDKAVLVFLNMTKEPVAFELNEAGINGTYINEFTGASTNVTAHQKMELPAWGYLVLQK